MLPPSRPPPADPPASPPILPPPQPNSPPLPPVLTPAQNVAAAINRRFDHAVPSSNYSAAGVIARTIDTSSDPTSPWLPCGPNIWCSRYSDRLPSTLISRSTPHLYSAGAGFLLSPHAVRLFCAYSDEYPCGVRTHHALPRRPQLPRCRCSQRLRYC
jgi:hypothetical protein